MLWFFEKLKKKNAKILVWLISVYILIIYRNFTELLVFSFYIYYPINNPEMADSKLHMVIQI